MNNTEETNGLNNTGFANGNNNNGGFNGNNNGNNNNGGSNGNNNGNNNNGDSNGNNNGNNNNGDSNGNNNGNNNNGGSNGNNNGNNNNGGSNGNNNGNGNTIGFNISRHSWQETLKDIQNGNWFPPENIVETTSTTIETTSWPETTTYNLGSILNITEVNGTYQIEPTFPLDEELEKRIIELLSSAPFLSCNSFIVSMMSTLLIVLIYG